MGFDDLPVFAMIFIVLITVGASAVFLLVFVAIIVGIIRGGGAHRKDRLRQLAAWAYQQKLLFNPEHETNFREPYKDFPQLPAGEREHYAFNVMRGSHNGRDVVCFDYHYVTTSRDKDGKTDTTTHEYSAVMIEAGHPVKNLSIRPESVFDKIGAFFGIEDIDFESAEFSRLFCVRCEDRRWAYDVIHPKMMEYMLARPKYMVQMLGSRVLVCDLRQWDADQFDRALRYGQGMLDLIPASVIDELKGVDT